MECDTMELEIERLFGKGILKRKLYAQVYRFHFPKQLFKIPFCHPANVSFPRSVPVEMVEMRRWDVVCPLLLFLGVTAVGAAVPANNIWSASPSVDRIISAMSDFHPVYRGQKSNVTHTSVEVTDHSDMEFCDGTSTTSASRIDCKYGYQFGARIPPCLCFKGL